MPQPRKGADPKPSFDPVALRALMERELRGAGGNASSEGKRAQDLVYAAMQAGTDEEQMRLVRAALELDPDNVDALLILQDALDLDDDERIETIREIVSLAAEQLGENAFKELVPHFWGFVETRPYMRARQTLAMELRKAGRLEEAAQEYAAMLELNEDDNQGVRYELLSLLFSLKRLEEARKLMDRFPEECQWNVVFAWGRVLERFAAGDEAGAGEALIAARTQNPSVEAYLKGHRKLPKNVPTAYSPGSKEEAICHAAGLIAMWEDYPDAMSWLLGQRAR